MVAAPVIFLVGIPTFLVLTMWTTGMVFVQR